MVPRSGPGEARTAIDLWRAQREGKAGLARRQDSRLADVVTHARARSRFYGRLYQGLPSLAGQSIRLADLPPVTKPELMASFSDWVTGPGLTRDPLEAFLADPSLIGVPVSGKLRQVIGGSPGPRSPEA